MKSDMSASGSSFELQPVLRNNARKKLDKALGVKSLEVRFEGKPNPDSASEIERAAAEASSSIDEIEVGGCGRFLGDSHAAIPWL